MNLHLAEIATQIAPGAHAALLVDQAGWHLSGRLIVPPNITLIPLPAKCPELNPQENVWQFMRDNWLSNRIFKSFDDIVDHCCDAWNKLIDQPWRIMSIGLREELCLNLGDGVDQAAEIVSRAISIPSLNFAPLMIFGNWF